MKFRNPFRLLSLMLITLTGGILLAQNPTVVVPQDKALLILRLPTADAKVTFAGTPTNLQGLTRFFLTPSLTPNQAYRYEIEARWLEGRLEKQEVRRVEFTAGKRIIVDFTVPEMPDAEKRLPPTVIEKKDLPEEKKVPQEEKLPEEKKLVVKQRHFEFTYAGAAKELAPGKSASVWLPVAVTGPEQTVKVLGMTLPEGAKPQMFTEKQYGNVMVHFTAAANAQGEVPFEVTYEVRRNEVKTDLSANVVLKPSPQENIGRFLQPDEKVPITGKPLELVKDMNVPEDQFSAAKLFYDVVNNHMKYSKQGKGWGQGDAVWACDSKFGNCSDFHSLFISIARGNKIPSKFEMGFPIPTMRGKGPVGGYHCWAWFLPNKRGWVPVDISEANRNPDLKEYYFGNLTEDRVRFSTGRDINLEPRQKGPPLNFFIYPYAEVDGQPYPAEKIDRRFAYRDLP